MTIKLAREMGLTHAEFFRTLPAAMGNHDYRIEGRTVIVEDLPRQLTISLDDEQVRRIALLRIPFTWVHFVFDAYTQEEVDEFMVFFESRYQRGGG